MAKVSPIQNNFNSGELSPLLYARVDSDRHRRGLKSCLNFIPVVQGGLVRRSGTKYVAEVKDSTKATRLIPFEFSTTQAYILEFGDEYIRFYKDNGQIESAGSPVEVSSPYQDTDLSQLKFTQSTDTLYIVHPNYAPRKLTRSSHTSWTLTEVEFIDGPYLSTNTTSTSLTPSGTSGSITITASAVTGINNDTGFQSTDVGRYIRFQDSAGDWRWLTITGYTSSTEVTCDVNGWGRTSTVLATANASGAWRLGAWSATTGYPTCVTFHEDRLFFAGPADYPQRIDGSNVSDYEFFMPNDQDGVVADSYAVSFTLNSNTVNAIRWLVSDEKGLLVGTVGGEWTVRPSSQTESITPTNINAKVATAFGSANLQPVQVGKSTLFVQRAGRKLRDMKYAYEVDGFRAPDLTVLSEHITESGIAELAYQKEPQPIVWAVRGDGVLLGMTYESDPEEIKVGWHRHIIGGASNAVGSYAKVESVAVIPSADGTRDELWVVVQRYIDGATQRYVEYIEKMFDDEDEQEDAFFVDSGLTYDVPKTITGVTLANPVVITSNSHGFSDGDKILISELLGMDELNDNTYLVDNATANTFELTTIAGVAVDSTSYTAYVSGGEARKMVTTISGLDHLEGQEVDILADGAVQPSKTVSSGSITLTTAAAVVHIGLGYNSDAQLLRLEAGALDGTALGKTRRTHRMGIYLHRSLGLKIGMDFDELDTVVFRTSSTAGSDATPLYSGILSETMPANYDFENEFCLRQDQPLPCMLLALMPQMSTQDRG